MCRGYVPMVIIELLFQIYFILFLVRLMISDSGQMAFNRFFQLTVKFTDPVLNFIGRALPRSARRMSPLFAIFILVMLQGFIYNGYGHAERILEMGMTGWNWKFDVSFRFWGLAKSLTFYLIFIYRFSAFLLLIVLFSPAVDFSDQISRLVRELLRPFSRIGGGRFTPLAICFLLFSLALSLLWSAWGKVGLLPSPGLVFFRSALCAAVFLVNLLKLFMILIIIRVILSWLNIFGVASGPVDPLYFATEPFLRPLRRLNLRIENWDFTPLVAIFLLVVVRRFLLLIVEGIYRSLPPV